MRTLNYLLTTVFLLAILLNSNAANSTPYGLPDSLVYHLVDSNITRKAIYSYSNQILQKTTLFQANNANEWIPCTEENYASTNDIQTIISKIYNPVSKSFDNFSKTESSVDNKGQILYDASYRWNGTKWIGQQKKTEFTYNDSSNWIIFSYAEWDLSNDNWKVTKSGENTFTAFDKPSVTTYNALDANGVLNPSSKIEYTYYPNYRTEYETTFGYQNGSFTPQFRTHFTYNSASPQEVETLETRTNNQWITLQKSEKSVDSEGNLTQVTVSDFDTLNSVWNERFKHTYALVNNTADSTNVEQTDAPNGETRSVKNYIASRHANGELAQTNTIKEEQVLVDKTSQIAAGGNGVSSVTNDDRFGRIKLDWNYNPAENTLNCSTSQLDINTNAEELLRSIVIYFTKTSTEAPVNEIDKKLRIWPNPFTTQLKITNTSANSFRYTILSLEGRPILAGSSSNEEVSISTSNLSVGAYLLQVVFDNGKATTKVVMKR